MAAPRILDLDRELLVERTRPIVDDVRGGRLFVAGGTGFVGRWILEALTCANDSFHLGLSITVLTRDAESFRSRVPHLAAHPAVHLLPGDVRSFSLSPENFQYMIQAAFDSSRQPDAEETRSTIVEGNARCLEFARRTRVRRFLFVSSGAVYGRQPPDMSHVSEEYTDEEGLAGHRTVYGEAKHCAERMAIEAGQEGGFEVIIARGFAFVGPHLPLDRHFAIGNFIADALADRPIRVRGDGTPIRSYLYATDLAIWLLTILLRGSASTAYNVGSEEDVSLRLLAEMVAEELAPGRRVEIQGRPSEAPPERYVPSTRRAREHLGLVPQIGLREAIRRTAGYARSLEQPHR